MLLARIMSRSEYDKYLSGATLRNGTVHSERWSSNAIGFCFMPVQSVKDREGRLVVLLHAMREELVQKQNVLCIFSVQRPKEAGLSRATGRYDWGTWEERRTEFCTRSYSQSTLKLVKTYKNVWDIPSFERVEACLYRD